MFEIIKARVGVALPALISAVLAIVLANLYIDHGWLLPTAIVVVLVGVIAVTALVGRSMLATKPYAGGILLESSLFIGLVIAGIAGALVLWIAIEHTPGETASAQTKQTAAAVSGALSALLGTLVLKPEGSKWNPLKDALKKTFGTKFTSATTAEQKDARDAVKLEAYSPQAAAHKGEVVDGWGWDARRTRTHHIADAI